MPGIRGGLRPFSWRRPPRHPSWTPDAHVRRVVGSAETGHETGAGCEPNRPRRSAARRRARRQRATLALARSGLDAAIPDRPGGLRGARGSVPNGNGRTRCTHASAGTVRPRGCPAQAGGPGGRWSATRDRRVADLHPLVGTWSALALVGLRTASPSAGRAATNVLALAGVNDLMQSGFRLLAERTNLAVIKSERARQATT